MSADLDADQIRPRLEPVAGLDALIAHAYARLTWRLPLVSAGAHWLVVMAFHALFVMQVGRIAEVSRNGFASLMAVGLVTAIFFHIMVNMLMTIGWAPVTGVPLPFLSYGGTAILSDPLLVSLLSAATTLRTAFVVVIPMLLGLLALRWSLRRA